MPSLREAGLGNKAGSGKRHEQALKMTELIKTWAMAYNDHQLENNTKEQVITCKEVIDLAQVDGDGQATGMNIFQA